jgi:hypothetical protein
MPATGECGLIGLIGLFHATSTTNFLHADFIERVARDNSCPAFVITMFKDNVLLDCCRENAASRKTPAGRVMYCFHPPTESETGLDTI